MMGNGTVNPMSCQVEHKFSCMDRADIQRSRGCLYQSTFLLIIATEIYGYQRMLLLFPKNILCFEAYHYTNIQAEQCFQLAVHWHTIPCLKDFRITASIVTSCQFNQEENKRLQFGRAC